MEQGNFRSLEKPDSFDSKLVFRFFLILLSKKKDNQAIIQKLEK